MKNFGWKSLSLFLGGLAICGSMSACTTIQHPKHSPDVSGTIKSKDVRGDTKSNILPFDPAYFKKYQHMAIPLNITPKGRFIIPPHAKAELRPGPSPFHPGGDTLVVYKDENKKEIGSYTIADPTKLRNCDLTQKGGGYVIHRCQGDEVELLFPFPQRPQRKTQREIHYVKIIFSYTDPQEERFEQKFDVSKILEGIYGKESKNVMR